MCKYFLNEDEKGVVKGSTGEIMRPTCFVDLAAYYNYLVGCGEEKVAQHLLKDVFHGEKVITKMIKKMQDAELAITGEYPIYHSRGTND